MDEFLTDVDRVHAVTVSLGIKDFALPIALILCLLLLFFPLRDIDRRDVICGLLYTLFCVSSGIIIFFAIPRYHASWQSLDIHVASIVLYGSLAAYRWFSGHNRIKVVAKKQGEESPSTPRSSL